MLVAWWYIRRLVRKRGASLVAGFLAGEGLSFARTPRARRPLRWVVGVLAVLGAGAVWWRRQRGGGDDWGDWTPTPDVPEDPFRVEPEPTPESAVTVDVGAEHLPASEPVAT
jgi:hypothetical protein